MALSQEQVALLVGQVVDHRVQPRLCGVPCEELPPRAQHVGRRRVHGSDEPDECVGGVIGIGDAVARGAVGEGQQVLVLGLGEAGFLAMDRRMLLDNACAALAAIIHKMRTGRGQRVEVPMFETFTNFMLLEHLAGKTFDPPNAPVGYFRQIDPDRQPFPTKDGYISIVAYTDESWFRVFDLLGNPEFLDDERFETRKLRDRNMALLYQEMARLTPNFHTADLLKLCQEAQIPAQPVRDMDDIMSDPHLAQTGFFERRTHPSEGDYFAMQSPLQFGDYSRPELGHAPKLGEQSAEVLAGARRKI